ncbi:branched-chain amino acid transport system II carrier protein [Aneurinibacillus sp. Ricciae_BoGa-3]|uniref:branched-chain amino acid transport system II carrier protein n=1 Tax=Aneurinibacillus sp. Ricciae_BoGa-3 TaxID=3022697 RepID=UPI0023413FE5|nr:branched-chain amino acid transport system II carrier protein [Aneurinibacillus sp. Ricciae_BoGa-3]WCK56257.1 branched-chain amino acid transport system II carrier protein [Aneurinibacillus sp. Ricciae_BoGa-3]
MNHLSKKELILLSFMLFSMFFGAGNLIFPAFLGRSSGSEITASVVGFIISAVGLPILGVMAIAKTGNLDTLSRRVHPLFAFIFPFAIYVSIGPALAIPRAGTIAYEMGMKPFISETLATKPVTLIVYTIIFFSLVLWLSLSPSKLVDRFGKLLTPTLLCLIAIIFVKSLLTPMGSFIAPSNAYRSHPFFKGFSDGYLTMDALASLAFGIVVATTIRVKGITDSKKMSQYMIIAGLGAGTLLATIYCILGYLGASSAALGKAGNGAEVLTMVMNALFGQIGIVMLGILFTLACLCVSIGLVISCSQYFSNALPVLPYKAWAVVLTIFSVIIANLGLNQILAISVPILGLLYPIAVVLIVLGLWDHYLNHIPSVYFMSTLFTSIFSLADTINKTFLSGAWDSILGSFPLYAEGIGWLLPCVIGTALGLCVGKLKSIYKQKLA